MAEILALDSLFAQLILALGAALILGNGLAWWKHSHGERDAAGRFRRGRVIFLITVGILLTIWGLASVLTG